MRLVVICFLYAEVLDVLTTSIGLGLGMTEMNPLVYKFGWKAILILKLIITMLLAIVLQFKKPHKVDILIPWMAVLPVMWNSAMLILTW